MKIRKSMIIYLKLNYEIQMYESESNEMFDIIRINIKTASYLYVIGTKIVTYLIISGIN